MIGVVLLRRQHGGISEAGAQQIPYGIQQPAVSAQIIQLEESLGSPCSSAVRFS